MTETEIASLLVELGTSIRDRLRKSRMAIADAARVVAVGADDTIFGLDRHVESLIVEKIAGWPTHLLPVGVFAEGLPRAPTMIGGLSGATPKYWLLIDPIDGTRGLMFDKRSAYFLAAAAPGTERAPRLSHCTVSVVVELPTAKAGFGDTFWWTRDGGVRAQRCNLAGGDSENLNFRPSTAVTLANSFGSVVAFFQHGKQRAAELAQQIAQVSSPVFDDQYLSTGGQMVELLTGRDRFVVDIRPFLAGSCSALCCHPYDLAAAPLVKAAGVELCAPDGSDLDAFFDLQSNVGWCGYANIGVRNLVQPIVQRFISNCAP